LRCSFSSTYPTTRPAGYSIAIAVVAHPSVRRQLQQSLAVDGIRCVSVPLEELFVELAGSDRPVEVS